MSNNTPIVLVILDGFGDNTANECNAITLAETPQWDIWRQSMPYIRLDASGDSVGLPAGQMGNSEVGHMHIGAGRVIHQDLTRINQAIASGEMAQHPVLMRLFQTLGGMIISNKQKSLHLLGLLSPGGVHSHENHLFAILELCQQHGIHHVYLHLFLDGRDTPPKSALESIHRLNMFLQKTGVGRIASITGRYYAMDRDNRWERIEPVYTLLTEGRSPHYFETAADAVTAYYQQDITDEFIPPTRIGQFEPVQDGDAIFFFNFRADRARQLTRAFLDPVLPCFDRQRILQLSTFVTLCDYGTNLPTEVVFPNIKPQHTLGEIIADVGLRQLRIAETEKYAHVTFFFNGGRETVFQGEDRILIPSAPVSTYDEMPQMRAPEITEKLVEAIEHDRYDVIICNYANADMVGHTGNFDATVSAIACLDSCLHALAQAVLSKGGCLLITADHGNAEKMYDETTHQPHTAHTLSQVPCLFVGKNWHFIKNTGSLIDIAPTILALLGLEKPHEMTGEALLEQDL